jgi:SNF2 family DNA or RNA helicase
MLLKKFKGADSMVVIDEWHNFKDINSLRTNNLLDFCKLFKCNDILPMSGTPVKALSVEALPLFKLLDEFYNADIESRLKSMNKFTKVMNDLLRNRLGFIMFRKLKKDVMKDLPEKHEEDLLVTIPNGDYYTLTNVKKLVIEFTNERRVFYKEHFKDFAKVYEECLHLF